MPFADGYSLSVKLYEGDTPVVGDNLLAAAWDECDELKARTKEEFIAVSLSDASKHARIECTVRHSGLLVGMAIFVLSIDPHVGRSLTVLWQYVLPQHRNSGISQRFMRELIRAGKRGGFPYVAYTHRVRPAVYEYIYRRI